MSFCGVREWNEWMNDYFQTSLCVCVCVTHVVLATYSPSDQQTQAQTIFEVFF